MLGTRRPDPHPQDRTRKGTQLTDTAQQHEIDCRIRAARDLLTSVLDRRATITDVGDGAIALVSRAIAIAEGDWEALLPHTNEEGPTHG